jgi:glycosyltransferase involved in cell wall biosynthesis
MIKPSIIIPTYKRFAILKQVMEALTNFSSIKEIIIVDSDSNDGTKELIEEFDSKTDIDCFYLNVDNNISLKRNSGIEAASSEYLIFLDDDCVPMGNFVKEHILSLDANQNTINCGNVYFDKLAINQSNYIRYKNSRHVPFLYSDTNQKILDYQTIVTMNMSIRKSSITKFNLFFDEAFIGYGMEDNEFGFRAEAAGMLIKSCPASIIHFDNNPAILFAKKMFHVARDGVLKFQKVNPIGAMNLPASFYFEPEYPHKGLIQKLLIKLIRICFNLKIGRIALNFLNYIDSYNFLYFPKLYKYVFGCYYYAGIKDRLNAYQTVNDTTNGWYTDEIN